LEATAEERGGPKAQSHFLIGKWQKQIGIEHFLLTSASKARKRGRLRILTIIHPGILMIIHPPLG
jgi:hypothetical protein